jgi:hypothetical protein
MVSVNEVQQYLSCSCAHLRKWGSERRFPWSPDFEPVGVPVSGKGKIIGDADAGFPRGAQDAHDEPATQRKDGLGRVGQQGALSSDFRST